MKKLNLLLFSILFLATCQSGDSEKLVIIDHRYSISIPSFLVKSSVTLNEDASLQYLNTWKEFYVIVIDESKDELQKALVDFNLTDKYSNNIKGYSDILLDGFEKSIAISHKSKIVDALINKLPARLLTVNGQTDDGIDVFYSLAFIQGKKRYYQIMAWTLAKKENEYKDKMNKIIYSLKEL